MKIIILGAGDFVGGNLMYEMAGFFSDLSGDNVLIGADIKPLSEWDYIDDSGESENIFIDLTNYDTIAEILNDAISIINLSDNEIIDLNVTKFLSLNSSKSVSYILASKEWKRKLEKIKKYER